MSGHLPPGVTQNEIDAHLDGSAYGYEPPETDERIATCRYCDGSGVIGHRITVYERGCGFPHDDVAEEPCPDCYGTGSEVFENEPIECDDLEPLVPV